MKSMNMTRNNIMERFVFVDRMDHFEYLQLLSMRFTNDLLAHMDIAIRLIFCSFNGSSVFLNTAPFGAGITSSDALAVCVPVVVLPSHTPLYQMALGQVCMLWPQF